MHNHVLIAEDDKDIVELLKLYLESNGFIVSVSYDGLEALSKLDEDIDIVIADLMMPRLNGYELIKSIREKSDIPIIIISAKNMDSDKVLGLDIGADAYITKPFNPLEVIAYIKALLRRYYEFGNLTNDNIIRYGDLELDLSKCILKLGGKIVPLTSTELKILAMMMKNPGIVFTKSQIYECISGEFYECDDNTMMVHISNIRSKIEEDIKKPKYIKTVRGLGYKFENKKEV